MLPIAERELRVAARQPRTYRSRWIMAGVGVLIFGWMAWLLTRYGRGISGSDLFEALSWIAHFYCLFAGVAISADCLSVEKRENTLGLLFLTHLKGFDIVLGKLMASSLNCFFGLLAMFPVLAIPLLMGGVQLADFARVVLGLTNTLFLSLAVGMLISSLSKHSVRATSSALLVMAVADFGLFGLSELLRVQYQAPEWAHRLELASPFFMHSVADSNTAGTRANHFWLALLTLFLIALACLALACWILPSVWKEKAGGKKSFEWRRRWQRWKFGTSARARRLRTRLLDWNPFFWLASRDRLSWLTPLLFVAVFVILAIWVAWKVGTNFFGPAKPIGGFVFAWFWATALLHLIVLFRIAMVATHQFAEDRKSGALELLLATPLRIRQIVRGQWLALLRQVWGPMGAAMLAHALFLWGLLELIAAEELPGKTGLDLLRGILQGGQTALVDLDWHFLFMMTVVLAAGGLLVTHWIALGWVGMWMGLKAKRARNAPWAALVLVALPPWPFFTLAVVLLEHFSFLWSEYELLYLGLKIAVGLNLANDLILSVWARLRMRRDFRLAVTDRFLFVQRKRSWRQRGRLVLRFALGTAAVLALLKLWHLEENWRGQRAWNNFKREIEAKGETIELASIIPPEVPADQNFGAAPVFAPLFDYEYSAHGGIRWRGSGLTELQLIDLQGQTRGGPWTYGSSLLGDWRNQSQAELKAWQKHFRNLAQFPQPTGTNEPAADVLLALSKFSPHFEAMHAATSRPYSRFPVAYENARSTMMQHWPVLRNIADALALRALASLNLERGDDAFRDLKLIFRFVEALGLEPFLQAQTHRNMIVNSAVQVIWEGLAQRRWSDGQLAELENLLQRFDLFADGKKAVRGEMLLQLAAWARFRAVVSGEGPAQEGYWENRWRSLRFFYSVGWTYDRQIQIYRLHEELRQRMVNLEGGVLSPGELRDVWESMDRTGAFLDNRGFRWTLEGFMSEFPRTQISLKLARIACALERYRLAQGHLPERLEMLVPAQLAKLPAEASGSQALSYRILDNGNFVLTTSRQVTARRSSAQESFQWKYPP
ncbi:MAG: ABC transporter permease subunit [Verrucomicrobia bacterium]|nr:ABC transporter permease subunit [Verrucomicrobiota bacterium]